MILFILFYVFFVSLKIMCALFGPYVDELNAFVSSGNVQQPIVIIQFARVKTFRGDGLTPLFTRTQILEF